jgi:iron(III) transport system permease protein
MFAAPLFLGVPANIEVMSTKIFFYIQNIPPDYTAATAMAVILLVITSFLVFVQWRILGRREFVTVTGKGYRPRPMDLGRWRWPVFGIAAAILFTFTVPPFIVLIQTTFMKVAGVYLPGMYTLSNYIQVFQRPDILDALKNTVILGVVAATAGTVICTLVSYVVVRTRFIERRVLDFVTWLPFSVAAIVLSLAFLWAYIYLPLPFGITLYGTLAILVLIVITKNLPIGVKTMGSSIIQVSPELEESAWVHGGSWTQTLLRIWVPLLKNSLQSVWIILFCFATTDLASLILLYSTSSRVLATVFYEYWEMGNVEVASVVGLLQAGIVIVGYVVVKLLGRLGGVKEMA